MPTNCLLLGEKPIQVQSRGPCAIRNTSSESSWFVNLSICQCIQHHQLWSVLYQHQQLTTAKCTLYTLQTVLVSLEEPTVSHKLSAGSRHAREAKLLSSALTAPTEKVIRCTCALEKARSASRCFIHQSLMLTDELVHELKLNSVHIVMVLEFANSAALLELLFAMNGNDSTCSQLGFSLIRKVILPAFQNYKGVITNYLPFSFYSQSSGPRFFTYKSCGW